MAVSLKRSLHLIIHYIKKEVQVNDQWWAQKLINSLVGLLWPMEGNDSAKGLHQIKIALKIS